MPLFSLKHSVWFHYTHYNNFIRLGTIVVSKRAMREKETGLEKMRKTQRTNYNNIHSWYLGVWFDYPHSIAVLCHGLHSQREKECNGSTHKFGEEFVENEIIGHFFMEPNGFLETENLLEIVEGVRYTYRFYQ